jgi:hypothetical protein
MAVTTNMVDNVAAFTKNHLDVNRSVNACQQGDEGTCDIGQGKAPQVAHDTFWADFIYRGNLIGYQSLIYRST